MSNPSAYVVVVVVDGLFVSVTHWHTLNSNLLMTGSCREFLPLNLHLPPMSSAASNSPSPSPVVSKDLSPSMDKEEVEGVEEDPEEVDPPVDAAQSESSAEAQTKSAEPTPASSTSATTPSSENWQAIWSPVHGAYYFYNAVTHETTWANPLQPPSTASGQGETKSQSDPSASSTSVSTSTTSTSLTSSTPAPSVSNPNAKDESSGSSSGATPVPASVAQIYALQEAAAAQGIDPSLAYLDPSLAGPSAPGAAYNFTAKFNAHTGAFTRPDGRDPTHLSEYERMKRMSSVYFNMEQWEQEVAQRNQQEEDDAANGKKRKRPTKKDLVCSFPLWLGPCGALIVLSQERFKEQKRLKKIAKTAWLRT